MLKDYHDWLESELKLLGNASHHAYSFGQANMAKRAIERLDATLAKKVVVVLDDAARSGAGEPAREDPRRARRARTSIRLSASARCILVDGGAAATGLDLTGPPSLCYAPTVAGPERALEPSETILEQGAVRDAPHQ